MDFVLAATPGKAAREAEKAVAAAASKSSHSASLPDGILQNTDSVKIDKLENQITFFPLQLSSTTWCLRRVRCRP